MSRVEENEKMIQRTQAVFNGKTDEVLCRIKGQELGVLLDISRSLAIIADCCLDKWQKDQIDRFVSMSQEDRKIFSDYMKRDEAEIINCLRNSMPKQENNENV